MHSSVSTFYYLEIFSTIYIFLTCDKLKRCDIWTTIFSTTYGTTKNIERNVYLDTKTKAVERENKNIMSVWERGLSQKLWENGCTNIIFLNETKC